MRWLFYAVSLSVAAVGAASLIVSIDAEFKTWRDFLGPGMALTYLLYATPIWLMQLGLAACLERRRRAASVAAVVTVGLVVAGFVAWRLYAFSQGAAPFAPSMWRAAVGGVFVAAVLLAAITAPVLAVRRLAEAVPALRSGGG
ncbi:MAG: hypothetical protein AAFY88_07385 [Acidobacteriota bacterium]